MSGHLKSIECVPTHPCPHLPPAYCILHGYRCLHHVLDKAHRFRTCFLYLLPPVQHPLKACMYLSIYVCNECMYVGMYLYQSSIFCHVWPLEVHRMCAHTPLPALTAGVLHSPWLQMPTPCSTQGPPIPDMLPPVSLTSGPTSTQGRTWPHHLEDKGKPNLYIHMHVCMHMYYFSHASLPEMHRLCAHTSLHPHIAMANACRAVRYCAMRCGAMRGCRLALRLWW